MASETSIVIRPMEQSDIDSVFEIDKRISAVERAFTYADMIDGFIGGDIGASFVAEVDGRVIGFALASFTYVPEKISEACTIQILGVDPDYRRQGIARKLVDALAKNCRSFSFARPTIKKSGEIASPLTRRRSLPGITESPRCLPVKVTSLLFRT